jgi:hypothetical protein
MPVAASQAFQNGKVLLYCRDPLTDCLRITGPPVNYGKDK